MSKSKVLIEFSDGAVFSIPVKAVALNRSEYYAKKQGLSVDEVMEKDTIPLFECEYEIEDWLENNMNWSDIKPHLTKEKEPGMNYKDEWPDNSRVAIKPKDHC